MKKMRKMMVLVLAVAMCFTMGLATSITAFAADGDPEYSITINNTNSNITIAGKTYTAYKLFDGTYSGTKNASYTIKKDSYFYTDEEAKAVLDEYFDFTATSGDNTIMVVTVKEAKQDATTKTLSADDTRALADALKGKLSGAPSAGSAKAEGETATITVAGPGYYIVDGTADPNTTPKGSEIVAAVALTNAKPTATVNPKADAPSVDKKITKIAGGTDKVEADGKTGNGSVGDKVEYELTSKVPNMTGYEAYQFIYTDTMSKGLTFNDDIAITIDGNEYTAFTKEFSKDATSGKTTVKITFTNFINQAAKAGKDIVIKYSATIDEDAIESNKEDNTVKLKYSHDPYDENAGTPDEVLGETPESKTEVYDTNIELTKVDGSTKLTGAKFKIQGNSSNVNIVNSEIYKKDENGEYYRLKDGTYSKTAPTDATAKQYDGTDKYAKVTEIDKTKAAATGYEAEGWVKSNSTLSFNGLGEGTYTITELVAPEGYNLLSEPITVVVTFDATKKAFTATVNSKAATVTDNKITFNVQNNKGTELPSTGGMGTTIFYILGALLVVGCGIVLVSKRRTSDK